MKKELAAEVQIAKVKQVSQIKAPKVKHNNKSHYLMMGKIYETQNNRGKNLKDLKGQKLKDLNLKDQILQDPAMIMMIRMELADDRHRKLKILLFKFNM